jgi:3-deoxy-manno-octulosonate cytidylyltransferase (CMP-KDO synthetase)
LIEAIMIDRLVETLLADASIYMATLIRQIEEPEEINSPDTVKVTTDKNNFALYFSRAAIPYQAGKLKDKPVYYKHIGLYAYTKDFLFTYKNIAASPLEKAEKLEQLRVLEEGFRIKTIETNINTVSVDTPEDLEKVRRILSGKIEHKR